MTDLLKDLAEIMDMFNRVHGDCHDTYSHRKCAEFIDAHAAEIEAMARDAEFGRAMKEAMNAEYTAAKQMRGKRQQEWITTYCLLRRLKSAAAHLSDAAMRSAKEDGNE